MLPEITCVLGCEAAVHVLFFHLCTQSTELINTARVISLQNSSLCQTKLASSIRIQLDTFGSDLSTLRNEQILDEG